MLSAGVPSQHAYEVTAKYDIQLHFGGGTIDERQLAFVGCTSKSSNGLATAYHCASTVEFSDIAGNGWEPDTMRAPGPFYFAR